MNFPESKKQLKSSHFISYQNFYEKIESNLPVFKQEHANGYFSQIQLLAIGLSDISLCEFVVYNFQGLTISSTKVHDLCFHKLSKKILIHYVSNMLPMIYESGQLFCLLIQGLRGFSPGIGAFYK